MTGVPVDEGAVHLDPVAGDVEGHDQLQPEHRLRIEQAQCHDQARGSTPRGRGERWEVEL